MCCMFMKVKERSIIWLQIFVRMLNPDMHDKICGHMQASLYDPTSVPRVGELEWPPCRTLILLSLRHEEEDLFGT